VAASKNVVVHEAKINGRTYLFLANFNGISGRKVETPVPQRNVGLTAPGALGETLHILPFMGQRRL
jgi:hypothetical protein